MAANTEVDEGNWQEICLHDAYHLWAKQKRAYLSEISQQTANSTWYQADKVFALHMLAVHAKFCTEPICGGRSTFESRAPTGISRSSSRSSSRSPSSSGHLNPALAASSLSRSGSARAHETESERESAAKAKSNVVNTEITELTSGLGSACSTGHEHHVTVTIDIGDEDVTSENALSDVTDNVTSEESQVTAEECSTGIKIKTEPEDASPLQDMGFTEDAYEPIPMENEGCQVISVSPGVACDQQTELMTDMTFEVKYEDTGQFGDNASLQLGGPIISNIQRINVMPSTAETEDDSPTTTTQAPSTSTDIAIVPHKCHVCLKTLRRKGHLQCTFTNQDSPLLCHVCQKDDGVTDVLEHGTRAKNPMEENERHHGPTGMSTAHLQSGKSSEPEEVGEGECPVTVDPPAMSHVQTRQMTQEARHNSDDQCEGDHSDLIVKDNVENKRHNGRKRKATTKKDGVKPEKIGKEKRTDLSQRCKEMQAEERMEEEEEEVMRQMEEEAEQVDGGIVQDEEEEEENTEAEDSENGRELEKGVHLSEILRTLVLDVHHLKLMMERTHTKRSTDNPSSVDNRVDSVDHESERSGDEVWGNGVGAEGWHGWPGKPSLSRERLLLMKTQSSSKSVFAFSLLKAIMGIESLKLSNCSGRTNTLSRRSSVSAIDPTLLAWVLKTTCDIYGVVHEKERESTYSTLKTCINAACRMLHKRKYSM